MLVALLTGCGIQGDTRDKGNSAEQQTRESSNSPIKKEIDEEIGMYLDDFTSTHPDFSIICYEMGKEENSPILSAIVAKEKETEYSSTIFVMTEYGVASVTVNSGSPTYFREEDGFRLEDNKMCFSMNIPTEKGVDEIHDYKIAVTASEDSEGIVGITFSNNETVR